MAVAVPARKEPTADQATRVFFCRHGETDWNLAKRFQGGTDVPLNEAGGRQAQQIAESLRQYELAAVWTSPLSRSRSTAVAIATACETEVKVDHRLVERGLGVMQGLTGEEVRNHHPESWQAWKMQHNFPQDSEVEPDSQVIARVEKVLFALAEKYPGKSVAIVGHGGALRSVLLQAVGTASISELHVGPGPCWRVVRVGDESHLPGVRRMGRDADSSEWGEAQTATTVLLCRHGETNWNLERKFQGVVDIPLNELGERQAAHIAKAVGTKNVAAIYTSPLQRARRTGEIVSSALSIAPKVDDRLVERDLGVMQGRTPAQMREQFPMVIDAWVEQVPLPPEAEAEASSSVIARIESAMYDLAARYPGKTVALILHGASIRCLLKRAVGHARITTPKNVSLTTMLVGPGRKWRLTQLADSSHMPKMSREELLQKLAMLSKL